MCRTCWHYPWGWGGRTERTRRVTQGRCLRLAQTSRSWSLPGEESRQWAPCPRRRNRRRRLMTTRVRVGQTGLKPGARGAPPSSLEHLTQGGGHWGRRACQGRTRERPDRSQSCVQVAATEGWAWATGQGGAGIAQPCVCRADGPQPGEAWRGSGKTSFQGRSLTRIGSQKAWDGNGPGPGSCPFPMAHGDRGPRLHWEN